MINLYCEGKHKVDLGTSTGDSFPLTFTGGLNHSSYKNLSPVLQPSITDSNKQKNNKKLKLKKYKSQQQQLKKNNNKFYLINSPLI